MSQVFNNILSMIGDTPMLELTHFNTGPCRLFLKMEHLNPGGSIKDRIGLYMIEQAEKNGKIRPGGTLVEATAGNTGIGLALAAQQKGYKLRVVIPDKMGKEKVMHLKAMGAEIVMTRSDVEKGHPEYYQDLAESIAAKMDNALYIEQFANENNPACHEATTGPEIYQQMEQKIDAFVYGMGTSGTMNGVGRYLRRQNPNVQLVLADPKGSVLADLINTGKKIPASSWLVEGIGEDYVPEISDLTLLNQAYTVSDGESFSAARDLLIKEGVFAGSSTGAHLHAALAFCQAQDKPLRVVTVACDSGNKYLSKMYDDQWMWNEGLLSRERYGDLRDLIAQPFQQRAMTVVAPNQPIATALKHMNNFAISQLPVVEENRFIGLVREQDLFAAVADFSLPVKDVISQDFTAVDVNTPIADVNKLLQATPVLVIMMGNDFVGLINRIDLLNYYKRESLR